MIRNNLPRFVEQQERKVAAVAGSVLILGKSHALSYTPVDTSTLANSVMMQVYRSGARIVGSVGYGAEYAEYVHDPAVKQRFRLASAKKEFLKLGFEESKPLIDQVVKRALKV